MDQVGYVTNINEDMAEVSIIRASACGGNCSSCEGECSTQVISVNSKNILGAKIGDNVKIRTQTSIVLKSALIVYVLPLAMLIIGVFAGITVFERLGYVNYELLGFIVGIIFLGISYVLLKSIDRKVKDKNPIDFEIVNIIYDKSI